MKQAGGKGRAERRAEGGQGRRDDDPASPERGGGAGAEAGGR